MYVSSYDVFFVEKADRKKDNEPQGSFHLCYSLFLRKQTHTDGHSHVYGQVQQQVCLNTKTLSECVVEVFQSRTME